MSAVNDWGRLLRISIASLSLSEERKRRAADDLLKQMEKDEAEIEELRTALKEEDARVQRLIARKVHDATLERLMAERIERRLADAVPPSAEKFLSLIVSPKRLEEALGDLEQGFRRVNQRHGRRYAVRWYYWHMAGTAIGGLLRWRWLLLFFSSN